MDSLQFTSQFYNYICLLRMMCFDFILNVCMNEQILFEFIKLNYPTMFNRVVTDVQQLPTPYKERSATDVICLLLSSLFALTLFIIALVHFNSEKTNNLYFKQNSLLSSGNVNQIDFDGFNLTLILAIIMAISLGILWISIVHIFPSFAPYIAYILLALSFIFLGVSMLITKSTFFSQHSSLKIILATIAFFIALILIASLCLYKNQLQFQGVILKYSVRFLNEHPFNFFQILIFLLLFAGLVALILFQHICFSNVKSSDSNFFNFLNPGLLGILNMIQFIWGLQFLKDSFIYIISGNSSNWYWLDNNEDDVSFHRLFCKNWGSIAAGSFMNAFFGIPARIIEIIYCHPDRSCGKCGNCFNTFCFPCLSLFKLVRTDSYAYQNIFGTNFCQSCRQCQKLCRDSTHFVGFQSPMRNFRTVTVLLLLTISCFLGCLILQFRVKSQNIWFSLVLIALMLGTTSFFASIHPNAGQGIQTCYLVEQYLSSGQDYMQKCIPSFRRQIQSLPKRQECSC